jgi:glutathione-independent formaldehyde dehydrogenase
MEAVVCQAPREVAVEEVEEPRLEAPTDILLRPTSSAICGTDLHIYEGRMGDAAGMVIGHEPLGTVEAVGDAVATVRAGQRVVVPTHICCGFCANCVRGRTASCLSTNPGHAGAAYGYPGMGRYRGAQAELVRVPFADANCLPLPGEPHDEWEDHFVLLADAFVTGWHACELGQVGAGDSVVIFGAGAVGLLAAHSAVLRGAAEIYAVDCVPDRLDLAGELGALPVDFREGEVVEQVRALRGSSSDDPMGGVSVGIDAIGFQARDRQAPDRENPTWVIRDLAALVNPTGRLAIAGVWPPRDPGGSDELERRGELAFPIGELFRKGVRIGMGRTDDERYNLPLREMITSGAAAPGRIVTQHPPLENAPEAYRRFDAREEGYVKVVFRPALA